MIYSWSILYSHHAMRKVFYFVLFQDDMNMNNFKVMINKIGQCLLWFLSGIDWYLSVWDIFSHSASTVPPPKTTNNWYESEKPADYVRRILKVNWQPPMPKRGTKCLNRDELGRCLQLSKVRKPISTASNCGTKKKCLQIRSFQKLK